MRATPGICETRHTDCERGRVLFYCVRVLHTFMISTVCSSHSSYFGLLRHEDNGDALRELRGVIMHVRQRLLQRLHDSQAAL